MSTQNNKKLSFQGSADTPQLKALKKTFCKFKIPSAYYSLAGYSEDAICIEQVHNAEWWVYDAEKGNKYNKVSYDSLFDACSELIARISESDEEEEKMKINFRHNLYANESLASTLELQKNSRWPRCTYRKKKLQLATIKPRRQVAKFGRSGHKQQRSARQVAVKVK